jgi:nitrite reductase/ring-hydroxylating ferredoxin subunit
MLMSDAELVVLCRLEEIPDGEGRGFALGEGADRLLVLVVRQGKRVHGYVNSCPHIGTPLDMMPDRFMTHDKRHILCMTHGARFRVYDGYCFAGPCTGQYLERLPVKLVDGAVVLETRPAAD